MRLKGVRMFVCICNSLRCREVKAAAADPATQTVSDVFRACGARPQCGKCLPMVADEIENARGEARIAEAVAAE